MDPKKQEILLNQLIDKQNPITDDMSKEEKREMLKKKLNEKIYYKGARRMTNENKEKFKEKMK